MARLPRIASAAARGISSHRFDVACSEVRPRTDWKSVVLLDD
jgi:hypothetical protein